MSIWQSEKGSISKMKKMNAFCKRYIEENLEECARTGREELDYLEHSTAKYKGETIYSLHVPKIFTEEAEAVVKDAAETMFGILQKVMQEYMRSASYRKLFGFSGELEDMILNTPHYENLLPICRVDIFLNEEDYSYKFCEFNGDGTSSMNEDRELNLAFQRTALYKRLEQEYEIKSFELFDSWAAEVKKLYESTGASVKDARIAVVDFMEKGCSVYEFEEFCKAFRKVGFQAQVCEIRDLVYDGDHLCTKEGQPIDVIYRRAVTSDIMAHKEEVQDFLQAVKEKKVCMMGDFCTHVIHDKILFSLLRHPATREILTEEENAFVEAHIPYTSNLTDEEIAREKVVDTKDNWIIKPEDSYGAKGVFSGKNHTTKEWEQLVEKHKNQDYLLQEYVTPYQSYNIDFHPGKPAEFKKYSNLTGLYVYNGKFAGIYSRQSEKEIISTEYDENDVASLVVRKKR